MLNLSRIEAPVLASVLLLTTCTKEPAERPKRDVDKQHMEAAEEWSAAICNCLKGPINDRESCEKRLKAPSTGEAPGESASDVFTESSLAEFRRKMQPGWKCSLDISRL